MNLTRRRMNAPVKKWSMNEPWFGARITGPFGTFSVASAAARPEQREHVRDDHHVHCVRRSTRPARHGARSWN